MEYCLYKCLLEITGFTLIKTSGSQALVHDSLKWQMQDSMALLLSWHVYIKWPGTWCVDFLECLYEAYECFCFQPQDHCEWNHADNKNPSDTRTKFSFFGLRECGCVLSLLFCLYMFILQSFYWGMWDYLPVPAEQLQTLKEKTHHSKINTPYFKHILQRVYLWIL